MSFLFGCCRPETVQTHALLRGNQRPKPIRSVATVRKEKNVKIRGSITTKTTRRQTEEEDTKTNDRSLSSEETERKIENDREEKEENVIVSNEIERWRLGKKKKEEDGVHTEEPSKRDKVLEAGMNGIVCEEESSCLEREEREATARLAEIQAKRAKLALERAVEGSHKDKEEVGGYLNEYKSATEVAASVRDGEVEAERKRLLAAAKASVTRDEVERTRQLKAQQYARDRLESAERKRLLLDIKRVRSLRPSPTPSSLPMAPLTAPARSGPWRDPLDTLRDLGFAQTISNLSDRSPRHTSPTRPPMRSPRLATNKYVGDKRYRKKFG